MPTIDVSQNYQQYLNYLPLFGIALACSILITPIVGYITRFFKIISYPPSMKSNAKPSDLRRLEKQPTPLLGGIAVILPFLVLALIQAKMNPQIGFLLFGLSLLFLMGIMDDILELPGWAQLLIQCVVVLLICLSPINITHISNPFGGTINLDLFSIKTVLSGIPIELILPGDLILGLWILFCINAVKWSSGTDGVMEGNSFIIAITLFLISIRMQNANIATLSVILAGCTLGFLFFNFYPSKIWSGSSGKSTYGYLLATLSVLSGAKMATAIVILILPIIDALWVLGGRIFRHKPKNIFHLLAISDKTHLHHKLMDLGLSERQIAFVEYVITASAGAAALAFSGAMKAFVVLLVIIMVSIFLSIISIVSRKKQESEVDKPQEKSPEKRYAY